MTCISDIQRKRTYSVMESVATEGTMYVQECWKAMLQSHEMQVTNDISQLKSSDQTNELVQVYLDQDMERITFVSRSSKDKTTNIELSSISAVFGGETLTEEPQKLEEKANSLDSFSLELKNKDTFIVIAPNARLAKCWILGLQRLLENQRNESVATERRNEWLREVFCQLCSTDHHHIKYAHVFQKVLNSGHQLISDTFFKQKLKEFLKRKKLSYDSDGSFSTREDFVKFYKFVFDREEIAFLFKRLTSSGMFLSVTDLQYFLGNEQCMGADQVTQECCEQLIRTFEVTQIGRQNSELHFDGFTRYLLSRDGELFNKDHEEVYQDMDQPLPHYYISSSHNTYLSGGQLRGESSVQAYSTVIEKGCRCVELDCWDGEDCEPIVYHGHTLTTRILFKDIIEAINESAFKASPYPVIVSLENHCSAAAQKKMAGYLEEIFGNKMYTTPVDTSLNSFPSPEFFKHKILIRGRVDTTDSEDEVSQKQSNREQENPDKTKVKGEETVSHLSSENDGNRKSLSLQTASSSRQRKLSDSKTRKKVVKELSNLINYVSNSKFVSYTDAAENGKFWQTSSFVEGDMENHAQNNATDLIGFNTRRISRIYPSGMRLASSNYSPVTAWNAGCQIVALNHQTNDEHMHLHYGKFRQNGRAGYVLKPEFLRDPLSGFDPNKTEPNRGSKVLRVSIISGQQLPEQLAAWALTKDVPDPYVKVQVRGVAADEFEFFTSTKFNDSYNPAWNESFETNVLVPELAMVKFEVFDRDIGLDDFIGHVTVPFESMQRGYRHIPLMDKDNERIPCASIFVHVSIKDLVKND